MLKTHTLILTLSTALLISACGFQLRGNLNLPAGAEPIAIRSANPYSPITIALKNSLRSRQVTLAADPVINEDIPATTSLIDETAAKPEAEHTQGFQIHILQQSSSKRPLTLGAGAAVAEYQLIQTVVFELRNPSGQAVMEPATISEYKTLPNDPNKVVSSGEEAKLIQQEMLLALAEKVAQQISRFDFAKELNKMSKAAEKTSPENPAATPQL